MINRWWEVTVITQAAAEDIVYWRLQDFGCQGTASQQHQGQLSVQAYIPQKQVTLLDIAALGVWIEQDVVSQGYLRPQLRWQLVREEDWAHSWQDYWHPINVGDRLIICPDWREPPPLGERLLLKLDPGMAFGTGTHPTTQLCLEALEMQLDDTFEPLGSVAIADIGCGSGILSVAAILLGAEKVYAVDTDPLAVTATLKSRDLNLVTAQQLVVSQGSHEKIPVTVDGILCNILADVIGDIIPHLSRIIKPHTWAIFSGLLLEQANDLTEILETHGWQVGSVWRKQDWCCLNVQWTGDSKN
ncbi:50S ribosomal protein L11 methyltransferase [Candidatus Synechococcus calcipolaris G9]|uniref:Ribosomal protein L11 methyltransferase n=1 Tax=Candidatus Synechococcus calcipolaris G9 TaxID=1497997 RepID=A0ABT6F051_9SYNE|nr:50S ribosomal protein L11 methyltransferase [Candidatus Synechococcus calcipolaris]MDG2991153.1 50S ribosomal protein L11 methyltransferase [Candidatus Synechococcus calcipolaris G9]